MYQIPPFITKAENHTHALPPTSPFDPKRCFCHILSFFWPPLPPTIKLFGWNPLSLKATSWAKEIFSTIVSPLTKAPCSLKMILGRIQLILRARDHFIEIVTKLSFKYLINKGRSELVKMWRTFDFRNKGNQWNLNSIGLNSAFSKEIVNRPDQVVFNNLPTVRVKTGNPSI